VSLDDLLATRTAVLVPDAIDRVTAAAARDRLDRAGFERYRLVDRGSYGYLDTPDVPDVIAALARLAASATGLTLELVRARALRLDPGDYLLARHDRVRTARELEVVVDLSPATVPGAELQYRQHGQVFFRIPAIPRTAAIIPTNPTVSCNHSYVSKRHAVFAVRLLAVFGAVTDS
jgi:hypothetical protein